MKYLPNISKWNTSNVKIMLGMFADCYSLVSLPDISKWDISKVSDIRQLFYDCNHYYIYQIYQNGILQMLLK